MATNPFDPAAFFLLDLGWENLFEASDASELDDKITFRCKGCGHILHRSEREKHHRHHKRVESNRRSRDLQETRERALAKARKARQKNA